MGIRPFKQGLRIAATPPEYRNDRNGCFAAIPFSHHEKAAAYLQDLYGKHRRYMVQYAGISKIPLKGRRP